MFFIITEVAFFDLTLPTSKYPKPICMTTIGFFLIVGYHIERAWYTYG